MVSERGALEWGTQCENKRMKQTQDKQYSMRMKRIKVTVKIDQMVREMLAGFGARDSRRSRQDGARMEDGLDREKASKQRIRE